MKKNPISDFTVLEEATNALVATIGPAKTARFLAQTHIGSGNYLAIKERLFGHLSVSEIAERIQRPPRTPMKHISKHLKRVTERS
jgi:hypothetical protein